MKKRLVPCAVAVVATGMSLLSPSGVFADEVRTSCEGLSNCTEVASASEILNLFTETETDHFFNDSELNIVLVNDIDFGSLSDPYFHEVNVNLYLGNRTMEMGGTSLWFEDDSVLNIYGGTGSIHNASAWAPVYFYSGTKVTLYSGSIVNSGVGSTNSRVKAVEVLGEGSSLTMNGGIIDSDYFGVQLFDNAQFVMNDGLLSASVVGLSGNGTVDENNENYGSFAIATINGGKIESGSLGIYAPHDGGVTTINGGTIDAASTGVEVRAGALIIKGGTINVNKNAAYSVTPNGNGSTTDGVAVAVSQHTTKKATTLEISGGTFTAPIAIAQNTTTDASEADIAKVSLSITGGRFVTNNYNSEKGLIYSQNFDDFIHGGEFSVEPAAEDIIPGYEAEENEETGIWEILPIEINMVDNGAMESDGSKDGAMYGSAVFNRGFMADRKAYFELSTLDDVEVSRLVLDEKAGGELVLPFDAALWSNRNGTHVIEGVDDTSITVRVLLTDEQYDTLKRFDKVKMVYFGEDGKEAERLDASLIVDGGKYYIEFTTTHLSTFGAVGVDDEPEDDSEAEKTGEATSISSPDSGTTSISSPDSGTMTMGAASASITAVVTAVIIGLLTSAVSFAFLIGKH